MPPQQPDRLPDLVDNTLDFRAHGCCSMTIREPKGNVRLSSRQGGEALPAQPE
jgi:hypothetical protein